MEPSPLPPHERTWRHPSEMGPTRLDVDTGGHHRVTMLASGALAVVMVAALVVAITPHASENPLAVSGTTTPASVRVVGDEVANRAVETIHTLRIASVNAIPNAIAALPTQRRVGSTDAAQGTPSAVLPDLADPVLVVTEEYAYSVPWRDVAWLAVEHDAIVIDTDGSLIARFIEGRLVVTADAMVGSAFSLAGD